MNEMTWILNVEHSSTWRYVEIIPAYQNTTGYRVEFFGNEIDRISEIDTLTGAIISNKKMLAFFRQSLRS